MKPPSRAKPISHLNAYASEVPHTLGDRGKPPVIAVDGEARAIPRHIESFEKTRETTALLNMLALGNRQIGAGRVRTAADAIARLRER